MKSLNFKKLTLFFTAISAPALVIGKTNTILFNTTTIAGLDLNWVLAIIAFIMLLPLYVAGKTFIMAAKVNLNNKKKDAGSLKKTAILLFLLSSTGIVYSQTPVVTPATPEASFEWLPWLLISVILFEAFLIVFFLSQASKLLRPSEEPLEVDTVQTDVAKKAISKEGFLIKFWNRINKFKPISAEADMDTGHNYDGIRELDNITPPWFTTAFILSIVFAIIYLLRYHVFHAAPLQAEEYRTEMAAVEKAKAEKLALQAAQVDENSVVMLSGADIENGKALFGKKCIACHGAEGGSMPGGVGPNLTDDYWIHGGSIKDIFKTIKYGWPQKGMQAWNETFSASEIAQLASFVKSLKGSNPPGAKEPQGDLYNESAAKVATPTDSTKKDSVK